MVKQSGAMRRRRRKYGVIAADEPRPREVTLNAGIGLMVMDDGMKAWIDSGSSHYLFFSPQAAGLATTLGDQTTLHEMHTHLEKEQEETDHLWTRENLARP